MWVKVYRLNIDILLAVVPCLNHKRVTLVVILIELDGYFIEERTAYLQLGINPGQPFHVEQTHCGHHIPCTQLALIFVLTKSK